MSTACPQPKNPRRPNFTMNKYKNPNLDEAIPELCIEVVADGLTPSRYLSAHLCERLRRHWKDSPFFRESFKRRDPRAVAEMWMSHWLKASQAKNPRRQISSCNG